VWESYLLYFSLVLDSKFHELPSQRGSKTVTLCGETIFVLATPKKLTKHDIRRLIGILRSGLEGRNLSWAKPAKQSWSSGISQNGKTSPQSGGMPLV
jgi:hypothetical protein